MAHKTLNKRMYFFTAASPLASVLGAACQKYNESLKFSLQNYLGTLEQLNSFKYSVSATWSRIFGGKNHKRVAWAYSTHTLLWALFICRLLGSVRISNHLIEKYLKILILLGMKDEEHNSAASSIACIM